jgi:hypothetical protein
MIARCEDENLRAYRFYGAKGIRVCARWHDFNVFAADIDSSIGPRPEGKTITGHPLYSLDRKDSRGNYEPGNVQWSTWLQQAENRSRPAHWKPL